ncbi:rhodanese-like domain-containing protein [Perlabentimonas gracilis]|uniref:rhodanese-like domain-containing protein n=1 Tax=Perlabentimonas gracilis TaxID=2715279 RepID=UPI00140CC397|nr:rhodanese-like domain-containing protein [Perlabentimonas gracilis]NHB69407.1 rhodanese-like domain-containing protein [Perlabentimonas gracilis]
MKLKTLILFFTLFCLSITSKGQKLTIENYLLNFDYEARIEMKIRSSQLADLIKKGEVQLVDIRFEEEFKSWNMPFAISIPLPELPKNLHKISKDKLIVTACPHNDRAIIAMVYLKTQGYKVKYLSDGLLELANYLRGNNALKFIGEDD